MLVKIGRWLHALHDKLRFGKDEVFIPLVRALPDGLMPNHITWARTILTVAWLPFAIYHPALWQIGLFAIIYFLDLLDGAMARLKDHVTYRGTYLDHAGDKFSNIAIILSIYGATGYRFDFLLFFVWWDMATAVLVVLEIWTKNKTAIFIRPFFELVVKSVLWALLLFKVLPFVIN